MKLTKPFNQLRSILQSAVGASGYRFLSIFMAALLFCGMNSQLVAAASVIPGANNDSNNNAPASGDRFNSESFLKASNPNADASQQWTWEEKVGAGIVGVALLGGAVAGGYKCYADRNAKIEEQKRNDALKSRTDSDDGFSDEANSGSGLAKRGEGTSKAKDRTIGAVTGMGNKDVSPLSPGADATPEWRQKASDALTAFGKGAYDLVTLKSCWPAKEVPEKPIMDHLNDAHTAQSKEELAEKKKSRTFLQKAHGIITLEEDKLPDNRTERQQKDQTMKALGKMPLAQLTAEQYFDYELHRLALKQREVTVTALTPHSTVEEMYAVLDPETKAELDKMLGGEIDINNGEDTNIDSKVKMLYFVATTPDIHPGHLRALQNLATPVEVKEKLNAAIDARWEEALAAAQDGGLNLDPNAHLKTALVTASGKESKGKADHKEL